MLSKISISEDEEQYHHDLDIKIVPQDDLDPDPAPIPNQKPKWAKNLIKAAGNDIGDPNDRRKKRSQYQSDYVPLCHTASLPTEWCNFFLGRYYVMIANDSQFGPLKNKIVHSIHPLKRRDKSNIQHIERIWKGSHAQKNHDSAWLLDRVADCNNVFKVFYQT